MEEHLFLAELFQTALEYDQVRISELACMEAAARRFQLIEEIYSLSLSSADAGATSGNLDERSLFLGQARGRGAALVSPELEQWVATELQARSAVQKERRKAREERALARDAGPPLPPPADHPPAGRGGRGKHGTR